MVLFYYCLFSYSSLLELQYGGRIQKSQATREQAREIGISVQETEWLMDVELFLEGQAKWEADSPHHLMMLHDMFQYAAEQGQKEVECMVCWGHQQELPKLDPEVDVSAVQLVGPQTSRKEIESLYYEVYKLWRLLRSPPGEPELIAEVVSSLEDHQGQERSELPQMTWKPELTYIPGAEPLGGWGGCLCRKEPCQGKGGPPESSGYGGHLRGGDRVAELLSCLEPVRRTHSF